MQYVNAVLAILSVVVIVWGLAQRRQTREDWHRARFPKDFDVERQKVEYRKACAKYDEMMRKKPPFGG